MECRISERLLDAEQQKPQRYEKDKGAAGIRGHIFEYKVCALLFVRAINRGYKFQLASNMTGLGAFDDVFFEYLDDSGRKSHIFVQLKSKATRLIKMSELKHTKGDFSLRKYYDSYIQIEEKFNGSREGVKIEGRIDDSLFIIYTNADIEERLKSKEVLEVGEENILMTGGPVLQFNEEEHKDIYEHLQELPKHLEFLSRLRIMYGQADETHMDSHIKCDVQNCMKLPEKDLELAFMCIIHIMKDWWQNCDFVLEESNCKENDLLRRASDMVTTTVLERILDPRKSELDELGITYSESAIEEMQQLTQHHKALLIFAPGRSTKITAAKIHQMLSSVDHIILKLRHFVRYKCEVLFAWKTKFDVLVVEGSRDAAEDIQGAFNEISEILNECDVGKKFIFISDRESNIEQLSALRRKFSSNLTEEYDDWKFTDIITEKRTFFLEKKISFQGTEFQIKNIVKESDVRMLNALDCDSMSLLLGNEKPSIGIPIENTLEYYIDRTLECVQNAKRSIQKGREELVPYTMVRQEELQIASAHGKENCKISEYKQGFPERSLLKHIEQCSRIICNETNELQSLCTNNETCFGRQNYDDLGNTHGKMEIRINAGRRFNTLLDGEDRIILVTDEPGMGKSTLLSHLAKETRERHPDVWIVRVNINNYTNILHGIKANGFDEKGALNLLTKAALIKETDAAHLQKQLFNYVYNSTGNMAVMIDGVDEVSPNYIHEVIQILRILCKTKIRNIWVTSRNSVKEQLEQELNRQSYSLRPFSVDDQKSFLLKFWSQKHPDATSDCIESLASRVVELAFQHLTITEKSFMGVPLQCMLLAEVFEENLKRSSASKPVELPEDINLITLYDLYVEKKWDIYISEKRLSDRTNVLARIDEEELHDIFTKNHKAVALMAILNAEHLEKLNDKNVLETGQKFLQKIKEDKEKKGIITDVIEGRPVFQHRTIAEYFVARWLCDNIPAGQIFMIDHIFDTELGVVRSMLDRILAKDCAVHEAVLNSNIRVLTKLLKTQKSVLQKDRGGRTPMHVAVTCRSPDLIRLLLKHGADVNSPDTLLGLSPVQYAIRMVDWEVLSLIMEKRPESREQVLKETEQSSMERNVLVLRAAAKYGHTDLLRYLISGGNCVNMALPDDNSTLLHEAARGNHILTVRTLVKLGASCEVADATGKTPLHVSSLSGCLEVTKFFVERQEIPYGENKFHSSVTYKRALKKLNRLHVRDNDGNTPLHLAAAAGKANILDYLLSAGSDLRNSNECGEYPLTLAARYGRNDIVQSLLKRYGVLENEEMMSSALLAAIVAGHLDTTQHLLKSGAPANKGLNEQPLHAASRMGHKDIVSLLLQYGASLSSRTDTGNTAFHLASEAGKLSMVKYLVELDKDGLNSLNYNNETPLHLAAENGRNLLVKYLVEKGCSINATSTSGSTSLHLACENKHESTVEYLLKHGANVNAIKEGKTPLHISALHGHVLITRQLLNHGAIVDIADSVGSTPLYISAFYGHTEVIKELLNHGASVDIANKKGRTPLRAAAQQGHAEVTKELLNHGANVNNNDTLGRTPLHSAAKIGHMDTVRYLLKNGADVNTGDKAGWTPLQAAAERGQVEVIKELLNHGANVNKKDTLGRTPLDLAAKIGHVETVRELLKKFSGVKPGDKSGWAFIQAAVEIGQVEVIKVLVNHGENVNDKDTLGRTPLHSAARNCHVEAVRELLKNGAGVNTGDDSGWTPLHAAAEQGQLEIIKELLNHGANMDNRDNLGRTPLNSAARNCHVGAVRELLKNGADENIRDESRWTPLHAAAEQGQLEIIKELLNHGADMDYRDNFGRRPLDLAAENGHVETVRYLLKNAAGVNNGEGMLILLSIRDTVLKMANLYEPKNSLIEMNKRLALRRTLRLAVKNGHVETVRELLNNSAEVHTIDEEGSRPLQAAAERGQLQVIKELLNHGANVNDKDTLERTPLNLAARNCHVEAVRELLKIGADVNIGDKVGLTPLHAAAEQGQVQIIKELLNHGANIDNRDNLGRTPLDLAAENGHVETVRDLLKNGAGVNNGEEMLTIVDKTDKL